jgi:Rieske Fe-S protein
MDITRRQFVIGTAACACGLSGACAAVNPAREYAAASDRSLPVPEELEKVGSEVKVKLPSSSEPILVWRSEDGLHAVSIRCTHRGSEVHWNAKDETLDCPSHGSRYAPDGTVIHGPAPLPLHAYRVEQQGGRLRISG